MRKISWLLALALIAFGVLSAHYTVGDWAHHQEWAASHRMPPPSLEIFAIGCAGIVLGGVWVGWLLGRR